MHTSDLVLEVTTEQQFNEFKRWWGRERWFTRGCQYLRITGPIGMENYEGLFRGFLEQDEADEIAVRSMGNWYKQYARFLRRDDTGLSSLVTAAIKDPASLAELKYEIKWSGHTGRQPRASILFFQYQGVVVSSQLSIDEDIELNALFQLPSEVANVASKFRGIWVPNDYQTKQHTTPKRST